MIDEPQKPNVLGAGQQQPTGAASEPGFIPPLVRGKRPYSTPQLKRLGSVAELTQSSKTGSSPDGPKGRKSP
jgi:hypothetical protein